MIDSPQPGAITTQTTIDVTGIINDITTGAINGDDVTVEVNGISATVSNGSFLAVGLPLRPGPNTLTATATDKAGNTASDSVTMTRQDLAGQTISLVSGNNQSAPIGTTLSDPLVVQLTDSDGDPVPDRSVTFTVTRSDGTFSGSPEEVRSLQLLTDALGQASVVLTLGTRAGAGNNRVTATATGFVGEVVFCASALPAEATAIKTIAGENQRGVVGQLLPEPFVVIVHDDGGNPIEDVPVTFEVIQGGGNFDGEPSIIRSTDSDGRAAAVLTLGPQEGVNANAVNATFDGLPGLPAVFTASGVLSGNPAETSVSGVVLDNSNNPIPGATARILETSLEAVTDDEGQFTIPGAPIGAITLEIDGTTTTLPGTWPVLHFDLTTISGQDNTIGMPIFLLPLDTDNAQVVGGAQDATLQMANVPGLALTVFANSVTCPDGSSECLAMITQVHRDKVPMPPPGGAAPRLVWTIQPSGILFDPPAQITYPNVEGLPPGQIVDVLSFDHDLGQFVSIGTGAVSEDGSVITSDPGVGIRKGGWGYARLLAGLFSTVVTSAGNIIFPDIGVGPLALDFGKVLVGDTKKLSFTIKNFGQAPLFVNSIEIKKGAPFDFCGFNLTGFPLKLAPGEPPLSFDVCFSPTAEGFFADSVLIQSNDPDSPTVTVALRTAKLESQITCTASGRVIGEVTPFIRINISVQITPNHAAKYALEIIDPEGDALRFIDTPGFFTGTFGADKKTINLGKTIADPPLGLWNVLVRWEGDADHEPANNECSFYIILDLLDYDVEYLEKDKTITSFANVANWEAAFPDVVIADVPKEDFYKTDVDRFFVRIIDPSRKGTDGTKAKIKATIRTFDSENEEVDKVENFELEEDTAGSGRFISGARVLVSNEIDDRFKANDVDDGTPADPTLNIFNTSKLTDNPLKIQVGGKVRTDYDFSTGLGPAPGAENIVRGEIDVCKPSDIETIKVRAIILKVDGTEVVSESEVKEDIALMNVAWAQCCIKFVLDGAIAIKDPPSAEDYDDVGYDHDGDPETPDKNPTSGFDFTDTDGDYLHDPKELAETFRDANGNNAYDFAVDLSNGLDENEQEGGDPKRHGLTREERNLIDTLADDDPKTIDIFIVNKGEGGLRGESLIPSILNLGPKLKVANEMIVPEKNVGIDGATPRDFLNSAHEAGHVLMNDGGHRLEIRTAADLANLMKGGTSKTDFGPRSSKRLLKAQCDDARGFLTR